MVFVLAIFLQFSYLQLLDFLSTVAFLSLGLQEGNPVVRLAMHHAPSPVMGLALTKAAALCLGIFCLLRGRDRLLHRINLVFAVVVAWNLVALVFGTLRVHIV